MKRNSLGTALITGAAKRIGRNIALNLAQTGYDLVIGYKNSDTEAKTLAQEIQEKFLVKCEIFSCDLRDSKQVEKLAEFTAKNFPNWNLLINNGSIFNKSKFLTAPETELFDNLNIHLISPLILSKIFAKNVAEKSLADAQIINMVDKNIARFDSSYFYYLLSKKFLAEFTKMSALELAPQVRVNAIAPGFILEPVDQSSSAIINNDLIKKIPLKTKGEVENIWQAVDFLLKNKFITGQILFIDGGASLNHAG